MPEESGLGSYLTDHMMGSVTAHDLARRCADNNEGPAGEFFAVLAREIGFDRKTLESIAIAVGVREQPVKQAAGVAAERLSRFKIDHRMTGSPQLSILLELELLYLGIQGKELLWRSLKTVAAKDARLGEFDFDRLVERAREQLAGVEEQRIQAAASALAA
jgi:hypothetical protein